MDHLAWLPSPAHLRALVLGTAGLLAAIATHRADLLVIVLPLVVVATWGAVRRPGGSPEAQLRLASSVLHEGDGTSVRVRLAGLPGARHATAALTTTPYLTATALGGVTTEELPPHADQVELVVPFRTTRWGVRPVGAITVVASSDWAAYRWGPVKERLPQLTSLPVPTAFDARVPPPHPTGLVGLNRSARTGEGMEFAGIRPFQPGDRMRRVHWPLSLRTRRLHAVTTYADNDSHILLVVDGTTDLGISGGVDGAASSLDLTVRATAALAEHYLRTGERVGVRMTGAAGISRTPAISGRAHLRSVLHELAGMRAGLPDRDVSLSRLGVPAGAFVVLLSPLASPTPLTQAVTLARRGVSVVVVDTLPEALTGLFSEEYIEVAWRIRVLERETELRRVTEGGVPVVRWRGPGSLDRVLRDVGRQAAAPRMARR